MMALAFAPKVRVNGVAPGLILPPEGKDDTYLQALARSVPLQCAGSVNDVAQAVLYLLRSPYITGQVIYVDGGRHVKRWSDGRNADQREKP
jgi:NAD(P)-dependent dehydrogenase (short-subunit alcohol dehydrogenase family)